MNTKKEYKTKEGLISAISIGLVLILIGIIFVSSLPNNLLDRLITFFESLVFRNVPGSPISLLAPSNPAAHSILYNSVFQFCIGIGILQIVILSLRFVIQSKIEKIAGTVGDSIFWFGNSFLVITYLNNATTISKWFEFWAALFIILGLSLIAKALVLLTKGK